MITKLKEKLNSDIGKPKIKATKKDPRPHKSKREKEPKQPKQPKKPKQQKAPKQPKTTPINPNIKLILTATLIGALAIFIIFKITKTQIKPVLANKLGLISTSEIVIPEYTPIEPLPEYDMDMDRDAPTIPRTPSIGLTKEPELVLDDVIAEEQLAPKETTKVNDDKTIPSKGKPTGSTDNKQPTDKPKPPKPELPIEKELPKVVEPIEEPIDEKEPIEEPKEPETNEDKIKPINVKATISELLFGIDLKDSNTSKLTSYTVPTNTTVNSLSTGIIEKYEEIPNYGKSLVVASGDKYYIYSNISTTLSIGSKVSAGTKLGTTQGGGTTYCGYINK